MTADVPVVPLGDRAATIEFRGGPRPSDRSRSIGAPTAVALYTPPRDTCDPRYEQCVDHHPACDCREAEFAENAKESRSERAETQKAFDTILADHGTYAYVEGAVPCCCTGCQIARAAHYFPRRAIEEVPF